MKEENKPNISLEKEMNQIFEMVKCVTCNGETIKDSNSKYSIALRNVITQKLYSGETKEDILEYIKVRYGEEAVIESNLNYYNAIIWILPLLFFLIFVFKIKKLFKTK